ARPERRTRMFEPTLEPPRPRGPRRPETRAWEAAWQDLLRGAEPRPGRPIIASGARKAVYGRSAMSRRSSAPFKAVLFDAYGTLLRNDDLILVPRQIVADHGLSVRVEEVWRTWSELYHETTQLEPFRTLRE